MAAGRVLPPAHPPDMEPPTAVANDGLMEVIIKLESLFQSRAGWPQDKMLKLWMA